MSAALGACAPDSSSGALGDVTSEMDTRDAVATGGDSAGDTATGPDSAERDSGAADAPEAVACKSQNNCYDPRQVCDPRSLTCVEECDPLMNMFCANPDDDCHEGQCFPTCTPFAAPSGCADGMTCVPSDYSLTVGRCIHFATSAAGASCASYDAVIDCTADARCVTFANTPTRCYEQCNPRAASWSCQVEGAHCSALWALCLHANSNEAALDPAGLGEACAGDERECALEAGIARGYCASGAGTATCRTFCRSAVPSDCAGGGTCHAGTVKRSGYVLPGVGVCE